MTSHVVTRHNVGRNHWYDIDGTKVDGVTTLIGKGLSKPGLINWASNVTAAYAVDHWDELAGMPPSQRLKTLQGARQADLTSAAVRGTHVHSLAEQLVAGVEVDVPEHLAGHVASYVDFLNEWDITPLLVEAVVAHLRYRYAGTCDLVADLPNGERWLFDVKTGRSGVWGETALQLEAYAHAEVYVGAGGKLLPMPEVNAIAAIHVRADGYDVYRLTHDEAVFSVFRHVAYIARQIEIMPSWVSESLTPPRRTA
jgi:hypothetical protein